MFSWTPSWASPWVLRFGVPPQWVNGEHWGWGGCSAGPRVGGPRGSSVLGSSVLGFSVLGSSVLGSSVLGSPLIGSMGGWGGALGMGGVFSGTPRWGSPWVLRFGVLPFGVPPRWGGGDLNERSSPTWCWGPHFGSGGLPRLGVPSSPPPQLTFSPHSHRDVLRLRTQPYGEHVPRHDPLEPGGHSCLWGLVPQRGYVGVWGGGNVLGALGGLLGGGRMG